MNSIRRTRLGISLLLALGLVVACNSVEPTSNTTASIDAAASAVASAEATASGPLPAATTPSPAGTSTAAPTAAPTPAPTATPAPTPAPITRCKPSALTITILVQSGGLYWDGAMGSQNARFRLKNVGAVACIVRAMSQPQLVNKSLQVVINGKAAGSSASLLVNPGGTLNTTVTTSNLCRPPHPPTAPTRVRFVLGGGAGSEVAVPSTASGGVPPCFGDPSIASGSIVMTKWAP